MKIVLSAFLCFMYLFSYAQTWESFSSFPDGFTSHHSFAFSLLGEGYIVTGTMPDISSTSNFYTYNVGNDEWTKKDDFPGPSRSFAIGDVWNNKAYLGFGSNTSSALNDLWEYDPVQDLWTELASCPCTARTHPAMVAHDDKIFLGLGGGGLDDWWVYDILTDTWERKADFPDLPRHHPFQFSDGEYVYTGFGHGIGFISNEWYRYEYDTDTWTQMATLPAEGRVAGTQFSYYGYGFVLSGDGDDHASMETGEFWQYKPNTDEWIQLPSHPGTSRWAPSSMVIDGVVYLMNGTQSSGGFQTSNWKFDLQSIIEPKLFIDAPDTVNKLGEQTEDYCNPVYIQEIEVKSLNPFEDDTEIEITINASSTAIEGVDFIMATKSGMLSAGETSLSLTIEILDDHMDLNDKTIVLDLHSNQEIEIPQHTITILENDVPFYYDSQGLDIEIGDGDQAIFQLFRGYYTNSTSYMLYSRDYLITHGLERTSIENITYTVSDTLSLIPYRNFKISMANVNMSDVVDANSTIPMQEVFNDIVDPVLGDNKFVLDQSFDYDGESDLLIRICFDNDFYTNNDLVVSTEVGYRAHSYYAVDDESGCVESPSPSFFSMLPNIRFGSNSSRNLFNRINSLFSSTLNPGTSLYFERNDSLYAEMEFLDGNTSICVESELLSSTEDIIEGDKYVWIDRIYHFSSDASGSDEINTTILMPLLPSFPWDTEDLLVLYSEDAEIDSNTEWNEIEVISNLANEKNAFIKFRMGTNGSYALGYNKLLSDITEIDQNDIHDQVIYTDISGRRINIENESDPTIYNGIYFKTYLKKGRILRTEKIILGF